MLQNAYVPGNPSPNRMDAAVWVLTELLGSGNGLLDLYKEQAEAIKSRQSTTLNRQPGTPEQEFQRQANAQTEQARKTDFKTARVFGTPVNKVASSSASKPKVVESTPKCPNVRIRISRALPRLWRQRRYRREVRRVRFDSNTNGNIKATKQALAWHAKTSGTHILWIPWASIQCLML
jgi:hypothetical protein